MNWKFRNAGAAIHLVAWWFVSYSVSGNRLSAADFRQTIASAAQRP
jgi:hypothetical protein